MTPTTLLTMATDIEQRLGRIEQLIDVIMDKLPDGSQLHRLTTPTTHEFWLCSCDNDVLDDDNGPKLHKLHRIGVDES